MKSLKIETWMAVTVFAIAQMGLPGYALAQKPNGKPAAKSEAAPVAPTGVLSLEGYLNQVRDGNQAFVSSRLSQEGAGLRGDEWKLVTRPTLVGSASIFSDKTETGSAAQGDEVNGQAYSLGVQQLTDFGLQAKLSYGFNQTSLPGASPALVPQNSYYASGPQLELSQALWRNGLGRETRATQSLLSAQSLASQFSESFRQTQLLADAESAYWRLALARDAVSATRDTLQRADRLKDWSSQRQKLQLTDRSDLLQSNAAVLSRSLELEASLNEEKAAARAFNSIRGVASEVVSEKLSSFDSHVIDRLQVPKRVEFRDDVKAAEQQMRLASANSQLGQEKNRPTFNVVGSVGLNGRAGEVGDTVSESFSGDHPDYAVGVRLEMPLDLGTLSRDRQGYQAEARAAEMTYQRRVFEQERLWVDLVGRFNDSVGRYKLAAQIEQAQREKMDYERGRHRLGRTTTYQVIQFEQDFANSQLARIRAQAEVLNIYAQLKTFGGAQ